MLGLVLAATFYVAPNGNNANAGTLNAPFATITRGVSVLEAGDRLLVRGGTYRESVRVVNKRGVQIRNYRDEKPVIDGKGTSANGLVIITLSSHIRFEGFEIRNGPKSGLLLYDVQDVAVRRNDVHHHLRFGIHVVSDGEKPLGTTRRVLIEENNVHHNVQQNANGRARQWMQGIGTFRARSVDIRGNKVYENFGEGIDAVVSDDITIATNTVWDNFSANIYLDNATNVRVDGNHVATGWAKHPRRYYRDGHPAPSIFTANEHYREQNPLRDLSITNNVTTGGKYGFGYGDYQHGGGLHRTRIANNKFDGATDHVLYIEPAAHDTTLIEDNIFHAEKGRDYAFAPEGKITYRRNCWWGGEARTAKRGEGDSCGTRRGAPPEQRSEAQTKREAVGALVWPGRARDDRVASANDVLHQQRAEKPVGLGTDGGEEALAARLDHRAQNVEVRVREAREEMFGLAQDRVGLGRERAVDGRGDERALRWPAAIDGGLGDAGALGDDVDVERGVAGFIEQRARGVEDGLVRAFTPGTAAAALFGGHE